MKLPLRILLPILTALIIGGLVLMLVSWQLHAAASRVQRLSGDVTTPENIDLTTTGDLAAITGDQVLLQLRMGDVAALSGDWKEAETAYERAVDAGGGIPALRKLAQAQLQRREEDAARRTIELLQSAGAREEDLLLLKVVIALRTGELVEAESLLSTATDSPHREYGQALLALIQAKHEDAQAHLAAVIGGWDPVLRSYARTLQTAYDEYALFPSSAPIHLTTLLARALAEVQECELALPLLTPVVQEQADYRDAWMVQGYCELTTERTAQALASFEHAYSIDPEKPEIQYFLGRTYAALDDATNATTFLRYAVQNGFQPEKEARVRLADVLRTAHNDEEALEQYSAIVKLPDAEPRSIEDAVTLAVELGQTDRAYTEAFNAAARWNNDATVQHMLGWAALEAGKTDEAKAALEKALELDPGLQGAKEKLGKL